MRTECLNCDNPIENDGDAFCKECDGNYFICQGCDNIFPIKDMSDKGQFLCKDCDISKEG